MKLVLVEARSDADVVFDERYLSRLPARLGIITTVQHAHKIDEVIGFLRKHGKQPIIHKGKQVHAGQLLGCDVSNATAIAKDVDAFLYIGSGQFHPVGLALEDHKDLFCYDPLSKEFTKMDKKEIDKIRQRKKGAYLKFLSATEIGVLVTLKSGQYNLPKAMQLRDRYPEKSFYLLLSDTLNWMQLNNFTFIECFVNTACPRIAEDFYTERPVVNYSEVM
ncbi:MAG TPA: diphthamide synthesis protein [Candidatus Nanoarchaeia archaeon]|nr:diphthamide synthesis protein [Candidatus Nanoarchaeia archaeon]